MTILVRCECGFKKEVPDSWAGKKGKCKCGIRLVIPTANPEVKSAFISRPSSVPRPADLPNKSNESDVMPTVQVRPGLQTDDKSPARRESSKQAKLSPIKLGMLIGIPLLLLGICIPLLLSAFWNNKATPNPKVSLADVEAKTANSSDSEAAIEIEAAPVVKQPAPNLHASKLHEKYGLGKDVAETLSYLNGGAEKKGFRLTPKQASALEELLWDLEDGTILADRDESTLAMNLAGESVNLTNDGGMIIGHHTALNLVENYLYWHAPIIPGQNQLKHSVRILKDNQLASIHFLEIQDPVKGYVTKGRYRMKLTKLPPSNSGKLEPMVEEIDVTHLIGLLDKRNYALVKLEDLDKQQKEIVKLARKSTIELASKFKNEKIDKIAFQDQYKEICREVMSCLTEDQIQNLIRQIVSNRGSRPDLDLLTNAALRR